MREDIHIDKLYLLGAVVFIIAFIVSSLGITLPLQVSIDWKADTNSGYTPRYQDTIGPELALVYIGSSTCAYSNVEELPLLIEQAKQKLESKAESRGWSFTTIGVSVDWIVQDGIDHLQKFGNFDEITTGKNWQNLAVTKFTKKDFPGRGATPQVVVIKRNIIAPDSTTHRIGDEWLLTRKTGVQEIRDWVRNSVPIPTVIDDESEPAAVDSLPPEHQTSAIMPGIYAP